MANPSGFCGVCNSFCGRAAERLATVNLVSSMSACVYLRVNCFKALCGLALLPLLGSAAALGQSRTAALSPEASLEQIELADGYRLELLASEPLVIDPVEVAFDSSGRMWVVEMRDYPFRVADQPQGTIRILTDRDGDGRFDHAQVFADKLEMPTGLAFWKDGVVVTLAGKLLFLRDTNGDLTADETQVWLEGFAEENEQLRANHPRLSPDGQWTIASGLRGGKVRLGSDWLAAVSPIADSLETTAPHAPLEVGSRDIRFNPRMGTIELITGPAQFGLCFDPFGQRYFCSNRNPAVKVIFEQEDLVGNPLAGLLPSVLDVVPAGEASQVFPLIDAWTTSNLHAGQFTAACGVFVRALDANQRGGGVPLTSEIFMCEPTGSLVKRAVVQHRTRYESPWVPVASSEGREWLASRDAWFRPVNVAHTPDGGVAIVDMHRAVIEHPAWVPDELKQRPDERWGDDAGRIYAVHSVASTHAALDDDRRTTAVREELKSQPLHMRSDAALAKHVASGNPWFQENAARILIERQATAAVPHLLQLARDPSLPLVGRVAAVRLMAGLISGLDGELPSELTALLAAKMPTEVQMAALHVLRLSPEPLEPQIAVVVSLLEQLEVKPTHMDSAGPDFAGSDLSNSQDSVPQLAFEAWLALGELTARAPNTLVVSERLLDQAASLSTRDPYQLVACAGPLRDYPGALLGRWIGALEQSPWKHAETRFPESQLVALTHGLAAAELKRDQPNELLFQDLAKKLPDAAPHSQLVIVSALEQLATRRPDMANRALIDTAWDSLRQLANASSTTSPAMQAAAVGLLSRSPRSADLKFLGELAQATTDPRSKALYLAAWATQSDPDCDRLLLELLSTGSPALQATALELIAGQPTRIQQLLGELESQRLTPRQLGAAALKNLTSRASGELQRGLQSVYDALVNSDRQQVVSQYENCLQLEGDPQRGQQVFKTQCASCHRIGDSGVSVGPDISDSRTQQPLQLLTSILNPNLAIDNNYFRYVILTADGQIVEGMVAEETADAIVIRGPENRRTVVRRHEVAELKATGVSLMPEGLEAQIDSQAMADLIAFIKGWRYLDGAVPGK